MTNADTSSLQGDLNSLAHCSHIWNLPFNEEKCKSTRIGKELTAQTYQMSGHELEQMEEEKDLDVIIDKKKNLKFHTSAAIKKANRVLGLIKRSFSALDGSGPTTRTEILFGAHIWWMT